MSTQVKSLPPWKVALIEKKRRHEEEDRLRQKEEEERLTQMPSWKRDILLKKQQQKNSLVYFAKPAHNTKSEQPLISYNQETISNHTHVSETSLNASNLEEQVSVVNHDSFVDGPSVKGAADTVDHNDGSVFDVVGPSEEHIIPIQQNPWLKTDIKQRKHSRHSPRPSSGSDLDYSNTNSLPRNHGSAIWHEPDDTNEGDEILDDEQEVAYGRGFVHKLLKKFKHLSARDEKTGATSVTAVGPKRSHSSENILEDASSSGKSSPRHHSSSQNRDGRPHGIYSSPGKARSMENLAGVRNSLPHLDVKTSSERRDSYQSSLDGSFSSGGMHSPRISSQGDDANTIHSVEDELPSTKLPIPNETSTIEESNLTTLRKFSSSENLIEDELPRANIVSSTRSIFENVTGTLTLSKTRRKAPSPRSDVSDYVSGEHTNSSNRDISDTSLPNGSATLSELASSSSGVAYTSGLGGEVGDGVSVRTDSSTQQINGNDRNANYKSDSRSVLAENRTGTGPAVTSSKVNQASFGRPANTVQESKNMPPHSIMQRNNKNSHLLQSSSNIASDILPPDKGSSQADNNLANNSKKRRAPLPPSSTLGDITQSSNSEVNVNNAARDASIDPKSQTKKPSLFLDFNSSESRSPKPKSVSDPPSYRDLYFSSPSTKKEAIPAQNEETATFDTSDGLKNGSSEPVFSSAQDSLPDQTESTNKYMPTTSVKNESESSKPKPIGSPSVTTTTKAFDPPKSIPVAPSNQPAVSQEVKSNKPPQSSKPANGHAASLTLPIPKAGEAPLNNKVTSTRKAKRPVATSSGSKSGSLLIRPASNLVPQSANTNHQFANIKKYEDVKSGVFQPPKSNPSYLSGLENEFDIIPVTNIDDVIDDVPVTNIDDITGYSPRLEQDADNERRILSSKYDFVGAGVKTSRSLLTKNRTNKARIQFNDSLTSTYEYPSEQSLLEELPPEPGDFDYIHQLHGKGLKMDANGEDEEDGGELNPNAGGALKSTPGLGSGGGLGSYRSRYVEEYTFGMDLHSKDKSENKKEEKPTDEEAVQVKPAEDDDGNSWSNAASSDLLF